MERALNSPGFIELLNSLADGPEQNVALVDTELREICPLDEAADAVRRAPRGLISLRAPIDALLDDYPRILLITDKGDRGALDDLNPADLVL